MGFPSLSSIGSSIGHLVQEAAQKVASAVTHQSAPATPAAPQGPVDTFEPSSASNKPAVCGGNSSEGAQCLPTWGQASGGGGGAAGVNPSSR
jgi:hypothetical protein